MKQTTKIIYTILLMVLFDACGAATPVPSLPPVRMESPTPVPVTSIPVDPMVITPENMDRLVQVRQLGMGSLVGIPVYSPDGQWLFLPTTVGVFMLDTNSYEHSRLLVSASAYTYVYPIAISPDGKTLAIGHDLIAVDDGHLLPDLDIPSSFEQGKGVIHTASQIKFSPDGQFLALVYSGDQAGVWRRADRKLLYTFPASSLDFSSDSRLIVTTVDDDRNPQIHLYDVQTGDRLQDWAGGRAVFVSATRLAIEKGGAIRVYDLPTGKVFVAFNGRGAAFSPDGQLAAVFFQGRVEIHEVGSGKLLHILDGDFKDFYSMTLRFAPDGQTLVGSAYRGECCGGSTERLSLWHVADGALIHTGGGGANFCFAPDGKTLAMAGPGLQIWNASNASVRATIQGLTGPISDLAFLPDAKGLIAFSDFSSSPFRVDLVESDRITQMGHADLEMIQGLSIHQLTYVSRFSSYLWGAEDLKQLRSEISKHDKYDGDHVAFSPDHQFVATSSGYKAKGIVRLWSIAEQSLISEQSICPEKRVNYLTFSPDRQKIAVACADPVFEERGEPYIQVWDVSIPKGSLTKLSGYGLYIMVMYSPDGRFLAAAGNNVDVWNAGTGEFLFGVYGDSFQGLGTQSVAFSPDGKILTIGLKDGSVEFWSVPEGKQLRVLRMSNFKPLGGQIAYNPVHALAFSPDGKLLAIGLDDGSIHLWGIQ